MANSTHHVPFTRSVVRFISSCTPIERHLLDGKPLADNERDLIFNTVLILQAALEVWQQKHSSPFRKASMITSDHDASRPLAFVQIVIGSHRPSPFSM